jgi:uncharacterized membrane protein
MDWQGLVDALLRWIHVVAGITWIGLLYFFNFVNGPFQGKLDGDSKKKVNPELLPRALFWFRWGAAWTWFSGFFLLSFLFHHQKAALQSPLNGFTAMAWLGVVITYGMVLVYDGLMKSAFAKEAKNLQKLVGVCFGIIAVVLMFYSHVAGYGWRGVNIHLGAMFGTIMAFNVWFRIWPAQKVIIAAVKAGTPPDAALVSVAGTRSRQNTYMSVPLAFTMVNAHTTAFAFTLGDFAWISVLVVTAIGWHAVNRLYKTAAKVQGF